MEITLWPEGLRKPIEIMNDILKAKRENGDKLRHVSLDLDEYQALSHDQIKRDTGFLTVYPSSCFYVQGVKVVPDLTFKFEEKAKEETPVSDRLDAVMEAVKPLAIGLVKDRRFKANKVKEAMV